MSKPCHTLFSCLSQFYNFSAPVSVRRMDSLKEKCHNPRVSRTLNTLK
ncbi:hypothetical protein CLOLEP_00554 [[Clostridium] leptum DSM 753]|uniref:Uncharacterized protein n=1 Tax=[Clostridium] leptum DSM 753 TaxID=428125 RepID=A7VPS6_9FIRM|nr:hypothetical protein CLOLEP_00554 [[Clostridium] leptum DSM 753]